MSNIFGEVQPLVCWLNVRQVKLESTPPPHQIHQPQTGERVCFLILGVDREVPLYLHSHGNLVILPAVRDFWLIYLSLLILVLLLNCMLRLDLASNVYVITSCYSLKTVELVTCDIDIQKFMYNMQLLLNCRIFVFQAQWALFHWSNCRWNHGFDGLNWVK